MEEEWLHPEVNGEEFWRYATAPVPTEEAGRQYPTNAEGFSLRDEGLPLRCPPGTPFAPPL